jgi:hypothetical protein
MDEFLLTMKHQNLCCLPALQIWQPSHLQFMLEIDLNRHHNIYDMILAFHSNM